MKDGGRVDPFADVIARIVSEQSRTAFAELFEHFGPRVKTYLMRQGASSAEAEEVLQEVMLALWRRADTFDPALSSVATWVYAIARNKRIDHLRRSHRAEFDPNDPLLTGESYIDGADVFLEAARDVDRLQKAVETLSPEQSTLIKMAYYEDKSHASIADETSLPLGTVKSRIRLALKHLRITLGDDA
ncbi:sigma-70 family RNA polymerase sigma factor [Lacibacterium aquatile]|uniref:Sigma-70 family RNA polymerase sigma factor n=1 Tax=Lacibacterium aquatile TaxID=1168082 RepID=A0ABW5DRH0_9PROT